MDKSNSKNIGNIFLQSIQKKKSYSCDDISVKNKNIKKVSSSIHYDNEFEPNIFKRMDSINISDKSDKKKNIMKFKGVSGGAVHSYSEEDCIAFTKHINQCLSLDESLKHILPLNLDNPNSLFNAIKDGVVLCKLINIAVSDTIDERAMNFGTNLSIYKQTENHNLAINAARSIGCTVINVGAQDLINGTPTLVLGLIWQIVKIELVSKISLKNYPELVRLLDEEIADEKNLDDKEKLKKLMALTPEQILLRWLNFHLKDSKCELVKDFQVNNFSSDLSNSIAYLILMHQLTEKNGNKHIRIQDNEYYMQLLHLNNDNNLNNEKKAFNVIQIAKDKLGVNSFLQPKDIVKGNKKLNLAFLAQLFNTKSGLEISENELKHLDFDAAVLIDEDDENNKNDSREEKTFRMWINSLNIDNIYINSLYNDLNDGIVLLKIFNKMQPGLVNWSKVNLSSTPTSSTSIISNNYNDNDVDEVNNKKNELSHFKKIENCNYVVSIGKKVDFSLVNIGGIDIVNGNHKLILALIWQMMRHHILTILSSITKNKNKSIGNEQIKNKITDQDIIDWANEKVKKSNKTSSITSFRDKNLSNGIFIIDLCYAIESRAVNWDIVCLPDNNNNDSYLDDEKKKKNAQYAINIARKLGAVVFLTWNDIIEVKSKMLMTLIASLMDTNFQNYETNLE